MIDLSSRVTIIAVGINKYQDHHLQNLRGAHKDVERIKNIFTKHKKTAIFNSKQFIELRDPTSAEFKEKINDYVLGRSECVNDLRHGNREFSHSKMGATVGRRNSGKIISPPNETGTALLQ